jgi:hypothetical protein
MGFGGVRGGRCIVEIACIIRHIVHNVASDDFIDLAVREMMNHA